MGGFGMTSEQRELPSRLQPGDLCVVVDHPNWGALSATRRFIGQTVVLVAGPLASDYPDYNDKWEPFWAVSGLPNGLKPSEKVLRKIPPPSLETKSALDELLETY
jgi:hypothetical protein